MPLHIGIVACSAEGAALCYRTICADGAALLGAYPQRLAALATFQAVVRGFQAQDCQAVVMGCTGIPLILQDSNSALPTLDSTRLLARAALRRALVGR